VTPPLSVRSWRRRLAILAATVGTLGALAAPAVHAATVPATWTPQAANYGEGSEINVGVTMHDGTVLRADVYYPTNPATGSAATGPFPVLLQQTPYGKEAYSSDAAATGLGALTNTSVSYLVDRGYIVVISDVRGTGDSGGTFGLFDPVQATDGATLVRWAARLPHSDGKVGLFGESYMGIDQFLTVGALGPNSPVKAMFPIISGHDIFSDAVVQGGIPDAEFSAAYLALVAGLNAGSPALEPLDEGTNGLSVSGLVATELSHTEGLATYDLPLVTSLETGGTDAYDGPYWAERSPDSYLSDVVADHIPAFLVGGWNDLFQGGEPLNYAALQNLYDGRPQNAPMVAGQPVTPRYQLMMGPWMHVTTGMGADLSAVELEWFDTWLLGQNTPLAHTTTPLHLNELQSAQWINTTTWPLTGTAATAYYFGPGRSGSGALSTNDGTLSTQAPSASTRADSVLWDGASSPCSIETDQWGAGALALGFSYLDTSNPCDTNDVTLGSGPGALTYTTPEFSSPQVLAGPIDATVYATATTTDTELVATIEEVSPTDQSVPLTSGALLGSLRQIDPASSWTGSNGKLLMPIHPLTAASARAVVPGQVTRYDIEVFPTFAEIPAGWRLRVTLTTSDTPHLVPTAAQLPDLVGGVYQVQRNSTAASYINVPLAPAGAFSIPCGALCSATGP